MRAEARQLVALVGLLLAGRSGAELPPPPEAATAYALQSAVQARRFMAVTANPHATAAALDGHAKPADRRGIIDASLPERLG